MGRPLKKAAKAQVSLLTPDGAHEDLVPLEEQPYSLPEGWKWVRLGATITLHRGVSYRKNDAHSEPHPNDYLIMRGGNICEGEINLDADNVYVDKSLVSQNQIIRKLDIIIVTSTGSKKVIGRAGISFQDYSNVAFGAFLTLARVNEGFNKRYISMYFQTDIYRHRIRNLSNGININNVKSEYITKSKLPLPPFEDQQRIVDRIESLFAKLDEAKEKAEAVLDSFESRKAAILHKAFTGELTANWREEHGVGMESWDIKKLGQCGTWVGGGTPSTANSEYWNEGKLLWITSKDMKYDIITDTLVHINDKAIGNSSAILVKKPSLIFVLRSGILRRTFPIAMVEKEFTINQDLKSLTPTNIFILKFLFYECKNFAKKILHTCVKDGTTVESIQFNALKNIDIYVPSVAEQNEIVRILDSLLAKEQHVKEAAENVLNQIDLMKKAILAKAFRGELTRTSITENGDKHAWKNGEKRNRG